MYLDFSDHPPLFKNFCLQQYPLISDFSFFPRPPLFFFGGILVPPPGIEPAPPAVS